jgi:hypothetical protein
VAPRTERTFIGLTEPEKHPAFYALAPDGWRDYWTLLHPPYTLWLMAYVAFGATVEPVFSTARFGATLLAFFLAVGLTAHALDELMGRPLRTQISDTVLKAVAAIGLGGAVGLDIFGMVEASAWLILFIAFGVFIVVAYNLELFGGRFHTAGWFAAAWGAFPVITAYFAQAETIKPAAVLVAIACLLLALVQRTLSAPMTRLRRKAPCVSGEVRYADGYTRRIDEARLRSAAETALCGLAIALTILAAGLVVFRLA